MLVWIPVRSGLKETYGEFPGWMSPDQPGSPLLQLWGCLGALDKTVAEGFCFLPLWAELEERELSLLKDLRGLLQSVELLSPSDSLWPHGLQHARLPYPSPIPGACSNSCPSSWWHHPTISSSVLPFSTSLQSFPAIRVFFNESVLHIRWPKYWSFSFSISPSNEYSGLISFRWLKLEEINTSFKGWTFSWRCFIRLETF